MAWIAAGGDIGYLPDHEVIFETRGDAINMLTHIYKLNRWEQHMLRINGFVSRRIKHGPAGIYCEVYAKGRWKLAIQCLTDCGKDAEDQAMSLMDMDGFLGGQFISGPVFQAFFDPGGSQLGDWQPDGMRIVVLSPTFADRLGFGWLG